MYIYKKIQKHKNVTYYYCQNRANSKNACIIANLSKVNKLFGSEEVVAWVSPKNSIEWNDETESMVDKDIIKNFVVNL